MADPATVDLRLLPVAVLVLSEDGLSVQDANPAACRLFAAEVETLLGMATRDLHVRADDHERLVARVAACGGTAEVADSLLRNVLGEPLPARTWTICGADRPPLLVIQDRREHAATERRIDELVTRLVSTERAAESTASGALIHSLSQPLMAAMGNIELLILTGEAGPTVTARLERAYEQLDRMARLLTGSGGTSA